MAHENKNPSKPMNRPGGGPGRHHGRVFVEKPKDFKGTIGKIFRYINYNKGLFIILMVIMLLSTLGNLLSPVLQQKILDSLDRNNTDLFGWDNTKKYIILLISVYGLVIILSYFQQLVSAKLSHETVRKMRNDLFKKFVKLPIKFLDTHSHGDLMSRMTNDVENISNTISSSIASLISGVMTMLGSLAIMLYYNWALTFVSLVSVVLTLLVSKVLTKKMRVYFTNQSKILGELNGHTEEMITGYKTVVAYNKEDDVINEFNEISNRYTKTSILAQIWGGSMGPLMNFISNFGYVLVTAVGAWFMVAKFNFIPAVTIGTITLFFSCNKQFSRPINEIANLYGQILTATACAERVFEILESDNEIDEGTKTFDPEQFKGNIEFKNINFSYVEGRLVLKNFSLSVKPGQKIALVGATGSGKTTVVNLLMRFYDVDNGEILIEGKNVKSFSHSKLKKLFGVAFQNDTIFSDTIRENITFGRDIDDKKLRLAIECSQAKEFIENQPNGIETWLTPKGTNISGGQKQRLFIARALAGNPKILILDDSSSALDYKTDSLLRQNIQKYYSCSTIIVAQRISSIKHCDNIIVLDEGKIVGNGTHEQLMNSSSIYNEIYQSQMGGDIDE